jgi:hypothetical protein
MAKKLIVGDIIEIPLSNRKKAYGQYLHKSKMGPIIQVFDLTYRDKIELDQIISSRPLFPPVITGLNAAIKTGLWKIVGNKPVLSFVHPKFVSTLYDQVTGKARIWFIWDGQSYSKVGAVLPAEYKKLEFLVVWDPKNVVDRIETGKTPFPYSDLIENNEFTPIK